jgi:hypothetical protein
VAGGDDEKSLDSRGSGRAPQSCSRTYRENINKKFVRMLKQRRGEEKRDILRLAMNGQMSNMGVTGAPLRSERTAHTPEVHLTELVTRCLQ